MIDISQHNFTQQHQLNTKQLDIDQLFVEGEQRPATDALEKKLNMECLDHHKKDNNYYKQSLHDTAPDTDEVSKQLEAELILTTTTNVQDTQRMANTNWQCNDCSKQSRMVYPLGDYIGEEGFPVIQWQYDLRDEKSDHMFCNVTSRCPSGCSHKLFSTPPNAKFARNVAHHLLRSKSIASHLSKLHHS